MPHYKVPIRVLNFRQRVRREAVAWVSGRIALACLLVAVLTGLLSLLITRQFSLYSPKGILNTSAIWCIAIFCPAAFVWNVCRSSINDTDLAIKAMERALPGQKEVVAKTSRDYDPFGLGVIIWPLMYLAFAGNCIAATSHLSVLQILAVAGIVIVTVSAGVAASLLIKRPLTAAEMSVMLPPRMNLYKNLFTKESSVKNPFTRLKELKDAGLLSEEEFEEVKEFKDAGLLTEEEFEVLKKQVLDLQGENGRK
jgi:hypothetical protein